MLSKLRISAHKLAIEGDRYLNIPKHERIRTSCNSGEVEDEEHFLLNCSLYKPLRQVLCSKLVKFNHQCLNLKIIILELLFSIIITITFKTIYSNFTETALS